MLQDNKRVMPPWVQLVLLASLSTAQPNFPHSSVGASDGKQVFHIHNENSDYLGNSYGQTACGKKFMEPANLYPAQQSLIDPREVCEVVYADSLQPALDAHVEGTETTNSDGAVAKHFAEGWPWNYDPILSEICPAQHFLDTSETPEVMDAQNIDRETKTPSQEVYHHRGEIISQACDAEEPSIPVSDAHSHSVHQVHASSDGSQPPQPANSDSIIDAILSTSVAVGSETSQQDRKKAPKRKSKEYICPVLSCRRIFPRRFHLKNHMFSHTGEKPYQCSFNGCNRKFKRSDELARHSQVHSEERSHVCHDCNKSFRRADHLQEHFKSASHRSIEANSSREAIKHIRAHNDYPTYACHYCNLNFARLDTAKRHFKTARHQQRALRMNATRVLAI